MSWQGASRGIVEANLSCQRDTARCWSPDGGRAFQAGTRLGAERAIVLDPFSGASGDMLLSSLVDLGAPFELLKERLLAVPALCGVSVSLRKVKCGIFRATQIAPTFPEEREHRSLSAIISIIEESALGKGVKRSSIDSFSRLAGAEARVHGLSVEEVHFHEVGALDAILDIVGCHLALDMLGSPSCYYTRIALGCGKTRCGHGEIPIPAPATLELLSGHRVFFTDRQEELVTPTAACLIASTFKPLPAGVALTLERVGYGAGSRPRAPGVLARRGYGEGAKAGSAGPEQGEGNGVEGSALPNVLRAIMGSLEARPSCVSILTSTIDDMNPEAYGFLMEKLFGLGVLEVYFNPVMMKKNRPGLEMTVITEEQDTHLVADFIFANTTTLGVRIHREERLELPRRQDEVDTPYGKVKVKVARLPGGAEKMSPEYEACREAAERSGVPILDVFSAVRAAWEGGRR